MAVLGQSNVLITLNPGSAAADLTFKDYRRGQADNSGTADHVESLFPCRNKCVVPSNRFNMFRALVQTQRHAVVQLVARAAPEHLPVGRDSPFCSVLKRVLSFSVLCHSETLLGIIR